MYTFSISHPRLRYAQPRRKRRLVSEAILALRECTKELPRAHCTSWNSFFPLTRRQQSFPFTSLELGYRGPIYPLPQKVSAILMINVPMTFILTYSGGPHLSCSQISSALETLLLGTGHNFIKDLGFYPMLSANCICSPKGSKFVYILKKKNVYLNQPFFVIKKLIFLGISSF